MTQILPFDWRVREYVRKEGWRVERGGRAMSDMFYLLVAIAAFAARYSFYGVGVVAARLIRYLYECATIARCRSRRYHSRAGKT